ncbi:hypothetical protein COE15_01025 [Bacillus cereus]|nr:hypothetical protein CN288_15335 [Bacillus sp. AFS023182]PGY05462.1 hypothetical protein COE15_01025 [Bacillus cereus]
MSLWFPPIHLERAISIYVLIHKSPFILFRKINEYTIGCRYECSYYNETDSFNQFFCNLSKV